MPNHKVLQCHNGSNDGALAVAVPNHKVLQRRNRGNDGALAVAVPNHKVFQCHNGGNDTPNTTTKETTNARKKELVFCGRLSA